MVYMGWLFFYVSVLKERMWKAPCLYSPRALKVLNPPRSDCLALLLLFAVDATLLANKIKQTDKK